MMNKYADVTEYLVFGSEDDTDNYLYLGGVGNIAKTLTETEAIKLFKEQVDRFCNRKYFYMKLVKVIAKTEPPK